MLEHLKHPIRAPHARGIGHNSACAKFDWAFTRQADGVCSRSNELSISRPTLNIQASRLRSDRRVFGADAVARRPATNVRATRNLDAALKGDVRGAQDDRPKSIHGVSPREASRFSTYLSSMSRCLQSLSLPALANLGSLRYSTPSNA
jgi:hypothetical protein